MGKVDCLQSAGIFNPRSLTAPSKCDCEQLIPITPAQAHELTNRNGPPVPCVSWRNRATVPATFSWARTECTNGGKGGEGGLENTQKMKGARAGGGGTGHPMANGAVFGIPIVTCSRHLKTASSEQENEACVKLVQFFL